MSIINIQTGAAARAIHVQQILNWLRGIPAYSEPVSFTGISSSSNYALNVANILSSGSGGQGLGLRVWNDVISVPLLLVDNNGIQIRPNSIGQTYYFRIRNAANSADIFSANESGVSVSGAAIVTTTGSQTLTNKTLTTPILNSARIADYLDVVQQSSAPSPPSAGHLYIYGSTADELLRYKGSNTGVEKVFVDTTATQTLSGKTLTAPIMSTPAISDYNEFTQIATPGAPSAGKMRFYSKTGTDLLYYRSSTSGEKTVVDLDSVQTISNKTFGSISLTSPTLTSSQITNYEDYTQQASTPGTPGAGKARLWAKTDNNLYVDVAGVDQQILTSANTTLPAGSSFTRSIMLGGL